MDKSRINEPTKKEPKALRRMFNLLEPKHEEEEQLQSYLRNDSEETHPFFKDPMILPKLNKHLRVD